MTSQVFDVRFALCSLIVAFIFAGCTFHESLDESIVENGIKIEDFREAMDINIQKI